VFTVGIALLSTWCASHTTFPQNLLPWTSEWLNCVQVVLNWYISFPQSLQQPAGAGGAALSSKTSGRTFLARCQNSKDRDLSNNEQQIFLSLKTLIKALGRYSATFSEGIGSSFPGIKWPRREANHTVNLMPIWRMSFPYNSLWRRYKKWFFYTTGTKTETLFNL